MYKCDQCDAVYDSPKQLGGYISAMIKRGIHIKKKSNSIISIKNLKIVDGKYECSICGMYFPKKGIATHIWRIHGAGNNHNPSPKGRTAYNKGLTKQNHPGIKKAGDTLRKRIAAGIIIPYMRGKKHTEETKAKIAKNGGGYRKGSGRGKQGWYKGYWCDSTWELAWVIYNLDHGIKFERNKEGFEYQYKNKVYKFFPDFIMEDGTYVEIKGYLDDKNKNKIDQFKKQLKLILGKNEIKKFIQYVEKKYGKLITLYENGPIA